MAQRPERRPDIDPQGLLEGFVGIVDGLGIDPFRRSIEEQPVDRARLRDGPVERADQRCLVADVAGDGPRGGQEFGRPDRG